MRYGLVIFCLLALIAATKTAAAADYYTRQNAALAQDYYVVDLEEALAELSGPEAIELPVSTDIRFVINVPARRLTLYEAGVATRSYPVTIGQRRYRTPLGPRFLSRLIWNPWWHPPDSEWAKNEVDTPPGPRNPLGKVKIPLGAAILLHGTPNPHTVGRPASHGCMRMKNEDVMELATWLQESFAEQPRPKAWERHRRKWMRYSLPVPLSQRFPLDIVYRTAEVKDDQLVLHPDVYRYQQDYIDAVMLALARIGIPPSELKLDQLPDSLSGLDPLIIPIADLLATAGDNFAWNRVE